MRRLHDAEEIEVFVTGSVSRLLTRDLASALRGRSLTLEVFPLSFSKFLDFRGITWMPSHPDSESAARVALQDSLRGGSPGVALAEEALRPLILGEYASLMPSRDVVERYGEFDPAQAAKLSEAKPAWRWLLEMKKRRRTS